MRVMSWIVSAWWSGRASAKENSMSECLLSTLASGGAAITGSLFAGDEKAMGITEGTVTHDLLDGEWRAVGLVEKCGSSASITS